MSDQLEWIYIPPQSHGTGFIHWASQVRVKSIDHQDFLALTMYDFGEEFPSQPEIAAMNLKMTNALKTLMGGEENEEEKQVDSIRH